MDSRAPAEFPSEGRFNLVARSRVRYGTFNTV